MRNPLAIAFGALCLVACQPQLQEDANSVAPAPGVQVPDGFGGAAKAGFELSEALCAGCHAVKGGEISPNPHSPTFEMIANTNGLTVDTLGDWLRNSHNFPERMNFEIVGEDSDVLAAYLITLRSEDYSPPIQ